MTGLLLIQLGTPDSPTYAGLFPYLRQFLSDRRVIEVPRIVWLPLLYGVILPFRSGSSAAKYRRIWDAKTGSPLLHYTVRQTELLQEKFPGTPVRFGMMVGNPPVRKVVSEMIARGVDKLIALPMFPQYSATTTASATDALFRALMTERRVPAVRVVPPYYDHPAYLDAVEAVIRDDLAKLPWEPEHFVISFHGLPQEYVRKGDPYPTHVERTTAELVKRMNWPRDRWTQTYQSRFGRKEWLKPYTDDVLTELAKKGVKRVYVALPGFTADCLETLDEIGHESREVFTHAGGEHLKNGTCLNDHPRWIEGMARILREEGAGSPIGTPIAYHSVTTLSLAWSHHMDAFILSAVRTPIGKFLGGLSELPAPQLGAIAITEALKRAKVRPEQVEDVIMGNVVQAGVGQAPARQAAIRAGIPDTIPAHTTNMVCGSGLKAVMLAAQSIRAGDANLIVAGGMESMSRAPFLLQGVRQGYKYGDQKTTDALVNDGLWCPFENCIMGDSADYIATKCEVSRAEQDRFAAQSHQRAAAAWAGGAFADEVIPVTPASGGRKPSEPITKDEGIRTDTTPESLAKLRPAFRPDGTVTAGNASQLSDGGAAVVVASGRFVEQSGAKPLARIVSYSMSGVHPRDIFIAPVPAVKAVCEKARLAISDIDLFELNEAFAAQMLACGKGLNLDESKVNVHGGAVALGHPIGASGARVLVTLLYALKRHNQRYGLASLCLGGGNAVAMIVERT